MFQKYFINIGNITANIDNIYADIGNIYANIGDILEILAIFIKIFNYLNIWKKE